MKITKNLFMVILPIFLLLLVGCTLDPSINHAPDIDSIPVIYALDGVLYTYDVEASDVDGDTLVYSLVSSPLGMTIDSSSGLIIWTPSAPGDYDVTIEVSDGDLSTIQSFTIAVAITPELSPPTGVEASDNLYDVIEVTWNFVAGATHYRVYRANSLTGTKYVASNWQTETSFDDTDIVPMTTYWYWVQAATSSSGDEASDYSDYDTGFAYTHNIILEPPLNVEASNFYFDYVQITWSYSSSVLATHYRVYRADSLMGTKTAISNWQTENSYYDKSALPMTTYWYWVKAATSSSGENASDYSDYDTGMRLGFLP